MARKQHSVLIVEDHGHTARGLDFRQLRHLLHESFRGKIGARQETGTFTDDKFGHGLFPSRTDQGLLRG